jgi:hypothetical protein
LLLSDVYIKTEVTFCLRSRILCGDGLKHISFSVPHKTHLRVKDQGYLEGMESQ